MVDALDELYTKIKTRRDADLEKSYTAQLMAGGTSLICQKVGEEALETGIGALAGSKKNLIAESADLLYHLLVLWAHEKIEPENVWAELKAREDKSGLEEKSQRAR